MATVVCSMLSKEQGITALGFCVVYDFVSGSQVGRGREGGQVGRWAGGHVFCCCCLDVICDVFNTYTHLHLF